jgi:hypothetical protein
MGPFNWDAPAASQESISHQYSETFFRQFIGLRPPGIVFFSIDLNDRLRILRPIGYLFLAEKLEGAMIVQGYDPRQLARRAHELEQPGVGARAIDDKPGYFLAGQAILFPLAFQPGTLRLFVPNRKTQHIMVISVQISFQA